jgi:hypothetical protein
MLEATIPWIGLLLTQLQFCVHFPSANRFLAPKAIVHSVLESAVSRYISSFERNAAGGQMANRIAVGMKIPRFSHLYSVHKTL